MLEDHLAGTSIKYSSYYSGLDDTTKECYREKVDKLGCLGDPCLLDQCGSDDWQNWPEVEYPDIFNFLIETPGLYTGEILKA